MTRISLLPLHRRIRVLFWLLNALLILALLAFAMRGEPLMDQRAQIEAAGNGARN